MTRRLTGAAALLLLGASAAAAQPAMEVRAEAVRRSGWFAEMGAGAASPVSRYLRLDARAARTLAPADSGAWRGEATVRFLLDPLAEVPWGLSAGAGLGYLTRGYLALVLDLEGPARAGVRPALTVTLGGGTRLGVSLRRARRDRR